MELACAFNQNFITGDLAIPDDVSLIEIGIEAFNYITKTGFPGSFKNYSGRYSLHIGRSPITEADEAQDAFISEVIPDLRGASHVKSCGFHLCGPRQTGIGRYGFTSHYECTPEQEKQAIQFVNKIKLKTGKEVWIENANFYSPTGQSLIRNLDSTMRIANEAEAGLILDLAHMVIDARNNNLDPRLFAGFVHWQHVVELHLSGIIKGRDGALHDGHSKAVDLECWKLFEELMTIGLVSRDVYINIEHSDDTWRNSSVEYEMDFKTCLAMMQQEPKTSSYSENTDAYARSYLKSSLKRSVVNMGEICDVLERHEDQLIADWFDYLDKNNLSVAFTLAEIDSVAGRRTQVYTEAFSQFVEQACDPDRS